MIFSKKVLCSTSVLRLVRRSVLGSQRVLWLSLIFASGVLPVQAQTQQAPAVPASKNTPSNQPAAGTSDVANLPKVPSVGTVKGTVVDRTGAVVSGAHIRIVQAIHQDQPLLPDALSDNDGQFSFSMSLLGRSNSPSLPPDLGRKRRREICTLERSTPPRQSH